MYIFTTQLKVFRLLLLTAITLGISGLLFGQTIITSGSSSYTVPAGAKLLKVEVIGGGGGGSYRLNNGGGGGGGGGAYASSIICVDGVSSLNYSVGSGGSGGSGTHHGNNTWFGGTSGAPLVRAAGGRGVADNNATGAAGGSVVNSIGTTIYAGGKGGDGKYASVWPFGTKAAGGGGGGAGSQAADGGSGGDGCASFSLIFFGCETGGDGGSSSAPGGNGGKGAEESNNGIAGVNYGGGGGGAASKSGSSNGGNGAPGVIIITVLDIDIWGSQEICFSQSAPIGATNHAGLNYSWSPITGLDDSNIANPIAYPTATTTYTLTVSSGSCSYTVGSVTVAVSGAAGVSVAGDNKSISCGASTIIGTNSSDGISYSWSPTTGLDDPNIKMPTASPTVTTTYTLTVMGCNGTLVTSTMTVAVTGLSGVSAGFQKSITCGQSVQLDGSYPGVSGGIDYEQNFDGCSGTNCNNWSLTGSAFSIGFGGGESLQCAGNAASGDVYSLGQDLYLTSTASLGISNGTAANLSFDYKCLSWYNTNSSAGNGACTFTASWGSSAAGPWTTIGSFNNVASTSCQASSLPAFTPTNGQPVFIRIQAHWNSGDFWAIIDNLSLQQTGISYAWSGGPIVSGGNTLTPTVNPTVATTYTLTVTDAATGCVGTNTVQVNVSPLTVNAGTDKNISCGATASIGPVPVAGTSYSWSPTTGLSNPNIANPTANPSLSTEYTLTATTANGCVATDKVWVDVGGAVVDAGPDLSIACGENVKLQGSGPPTNAYTWTGGPVVSGGNTANPTVSPTTTTTYTVVYNDGGCSGTDDVVVTVNAPTAGNVSPSSNTICANDVVILNSYGASSSGHWQYNDAGTWYNLTGATTNPYVLPIADNPSSTTGYRFVVSCGGNTVYSDVLTVSLKPHQDCYCLPTYDNAACGSGDQINRVRLAGDNITLDNASGCSNLPNNYTDYTSSTAIPDLFPEETYTVRVTSTETTLPQNERIKIWIDWNNDGVFDHPSELVASSGNAANTSGLNQGSAGNWYRDFNITVPIGAPGGQHRMRVRMVGMGVAATADFGPCTHEGWGETEDYLIEVVPIEDCAGLPEAGLITGPTEICKNVPFGIYATGAEIANGINYQWEHSGSGATGTWSAIPGETATTLNLVSGITGISYYRLKVECSISGSYISYSDTLIVNIKLASECYCEPVGTPNNHGIVKFEIKDGVGATYLSNSSAVPSPYTDYSYTVAPAELQAGTEYHFSVTGSVGAGFHGASIWINWNDNSDFGASEKILTIDSIMANQTKTGTFYIPLTVPAGTHSLRVRYVKDSIGNTIDPCNAYNDAETEDYLVNITVPPACSGTPNAGVINPVDVVCSNHPQEPIMLTTTGTTTGGGIVYQWQYAVAGTNIWQNAVGNTGTILYLPNGLTQSTDFRLRVKCEESSEIVYTDPLTITVQICYCEPTGGENNAHEITNFKLTNLDNSTVYLDNPSVTGDGVNGYSDFTATVLPAILFIGDLYQATLKSGAGANDHGAAVWIDYNDNGIFEASEKVTQVVSSLGPNVSHNLPSFTVLGNPGVHRMRVQYGRNVDGASMYPCVMASVNSETEDYFVRVIAKDCPGYTGTLLSTTGENKACAEQPYGMYLENSACDGKIYLDIRGHGSYEINSVSGTYSTSGSGGGGTIVDFKEINPYANNNGTAYTLTVGLNSNIIIYNNGNMIVNGANSTSLTYYFYANPIVSPATLSITLPNLVVVKRTVEDCRDLFLNLPLENTGYCKPINIDLPYQVTCDATGAVLSSGVHNVTVYPQVPSSTNDIVMVVWDEEECNWSVSIPPNSDCDLDDIGSVFTISPDPLTEAFGDGCYIGDREFTVTYLGIEDSPNCCGTGGPVEGYDTYSYTTTTAVPSTLPHYTTSNVAAKLTVPPHNSGGFATGGSVNVIVNNYCGRSVTGGTLGDYKVFIYIDGYLAHVVEGLTGNQNLTIPISQLAVNYTHISTLEVMVNPTLVGSGSTQAVYSPGIICNGTVSSGHWKADIEVNLNMTFEDGIGSEADCAPELVRSHTQCAVIYNPEAIAAANPIHPLYCFGNGIDLTVQGGTDFNDNIGDLVNIWYAVPGDDGDQCETEGYIEVFNDFNYKPADLCYPGAHHNVTNYAIGNGALKLEATGADPWVWMFPLADEQGLSTTIDADENKYINVRFRITDPTSAPTGNNVFMQIFYTKQLCAAVTDPFVETRSRSKYLDGQNGDWQIVSIPMHESAEWSGLVTGLRLDYLNSNTWVTSMDVDFIIASKYPMVFEGKNMVLTDTDEFYPTGPTTYYTKKVSRCGISDCYSTFVSLPDRADQLSKNAETAICWVKGNKKISFYTQEGNINGVPQFEGNFVASINPNGNETVLAITSNVKSEVEYMWACDDPTNENYNTAYLQRGFLIEELDLPGYTPVSSGNNYSVFFPFMEFEAQELTNKGPVLTPLNPNDDLSNSTAINELSATKYDGNFENDTPVDNCNDGVSQVILQVGSNDLTAGEFASTQLNPPIVGNNYYVRFDVPNFSEFWLHKAFNNSPLPVELISFEVKCVDAGAKIIWSTGSENNSDYFTVEFSRDGMVWNVVKTLQGAGSSNSLNNYLVMDENANKGYYRLIQVDFDGNKTIFGPISSKCEPDINNMIVYPNPSTGTFTVEISTMSGLGEVNIRVHEATGRMVAIQKVNVHSGINKVEFNERALAPGTYFVSIEGADKGKFIPVKLIVR